MERLRGKIKNKLYELYDTVADGEDSGVDDPDYDQAKKDVNKVLDAIDNNKSLDDLANRINEPIEKAQIISAFTKKVGLPKSELFNVMGAIRGMAETREIKEEDDFEVTDPDAEAYIEDLFSKGEVKKALKKINKRKEKALLIIKFAERIGVPIQEMYDLLGQMDLKALESNRARMTKNELVETVLKK